MRSPRSLLGGLLALACAAGPLAASAAEEHIQLPNERWSFESALGTFDLASAQRGFQVYSQVCANCHSMKFMHYRDLSGLGFNAEQIKAIAASVTVPLGLNDEGEVKMGPGLPSSRFRSPFPNPVAAAAANNGAAPPDLSLIVNAREGGPNYIYGVLIGFSDPPPGFNLVEGTYYNKVFPGHQIKMPPPLQDGSVTYTDGTQSSLSQEARDVTTFLAWAANPEMVERKQLGVKWVLFLAVMTGLTYAVKRKVWSDVHH